MKRVRARQIRKWFKEHGFISTIRKLRVAEGTGLTAAAKRCSKLRTKWRREGTYRVRSSW